MEGVDQKHDSDWIERVKSEGTVPLLELNNCSNGWASPPGGAFLLRGPDYLKTKAKIRGGDYLLKPLGFDWIKGQTKISELLNNPKCRVRRALEAHWSNNQKPFVWAFNLQLPSKENFSAVAYFVAVEPFPEDSLVSRFLKSDENFKISRLKLIANIVKGPWLVRKAVGEQAICVIGRALTCTYHTGQNFIEVDIDVGSSMVANAIVHLAFGYLKTLTVDLAFLIEGQTESELPERILGAIRFSALDAASAREVELPSERSTGNLNRSMSRQSSFWKSIGSGLSNLIQSGAHDGDSSSSASPTLTKKMSVMTTCDEDIIKKL